MANLRKVMQVFEEAAPPVHMPVVVGNELFMLTQQDVRRVKDIRFLTYNRLAPNGLVTPNPSQWFSESVDNHFKVSFMPGTLPHTPQPMDLLYQRQLQQHVEAIRAFEQTPAQNVADIFTQLNWSKQSTHSAPYQMGHSTAPSTSGRRKRKHDHSRRLRCKNSQTRTQTKPQHCHHRQTRPETKPQQCQHCQNKPRTKLQHCQCTQTRPETKSQACNTERSEKPNSWQRSQDLNMCEETMQQSLKHSQHVSFLPSDQNRIVPPPPTDQYGDLQQRNKPTQAAETFSSGPSDHPCRHQNRTVSPPPFFIPSDQNEKEMFLDHESHQ